jgi:diguanylate cyclase (GGDEF)-like protein
MTQRKRPAAVQAAEQTPVPAPPVERHEAAAEIATEIAALQAALARAEARIAELEARADIDPLLDILNRRAFERELARSLAYLDRYGGAIALVYVDLDGFKAVNDRHGHGAGDALLRAVSAALTGAVRASDIVARLGGDEFALLLWNAGEAQAQAKAVELENAVAAATVAHEGVVLSVTASAGAAAVTPGRTAAEVLDAADRAMYARKTDARKSSRRG